MPDTADVRIDASGIVRFRCPECSRGLRVPQGVIGRKIGCPYCQTLYQSSFALVVESNSTEVSQIELSKDETAQSQEAAQTQSLARYLPSKANVASAMGIIAKTVKSGKELGVQTVQGAAAVVNTTAQNAAAAVSSTAKKAAAAATPLTQIVTGMASVLLPGTGEVIGGKTKQGFCTMAAYFGLVGVATAGGAWIAAPIALGVFSAMRGVQAGRELGKKMKDAIEGGDIEISAEMGNNAASMTDEQIEQLMLKSEEAELSKAQENPQKRIILTKIGSRVS
jgi:hypothetical protein